jgi:capsular exopolysaccharide synthesis family protein
LDVGFRSAEEVEAAGGPPVLAQVPIVRGGAVPAAYALDRPRSAYAAAIHAIYARRLLMAGERPPRVLLFTSAKPEEGKSTISLSLARQQALSGRRVVFVEADFHRSCISRVAGVGAAPGLMDVLSGAAGLKDVIQPDSRSTVDLIVAGPQQATNSERPAVGAVGTILNALRDEYDVIVIDAPPVLGLADANIFSAVADATLMIVQWGKTRREVFKYGVGEIIKFGGRIDGVILSKVDTRKQAYYGYGDSHAYTGKATKAYVS